QGKIIDELAYDEHWQFKLINNDECVALERIDYNKPTQDAANWHSAATSAGYGTPGYQNSQFKTDVLLQGSITVTPAVFSPDNDGSDDFLTISYQFPEQGYMCNITIFDAGGRPVRFLTRNALCGMRGYFRWDGLDEKSAKLPIGVYVILTEVFNLKGKTNRFKQAVTLARRL
ncbi:MAG TPA: gliding motility-associated C-terminal domain-containing protein, partial [Chitinophagaceae bacterium]|nr:gliding motility-associated C-terminal domain-containing protein [Chitinophagaceae bacterium]